MNKKVAFILIALIGIGLYALPSTTALFAGQHSFVDIDDSGNQIDCVKCHGDVQAELSIENVDTPHNEFECETCHRIEAGKASGDNRIYSRVYTGNVTGLGWINRTLVMTATDFESSLFPATIPANGTVSIPGALSFAVSPGNVGVVADLPVIQSHGHDADASIINLLNNDGTPKDTDVSTQYSGVSLGKVKDVQWIMTGDYPAINLVGLGSEVVNPGTTYHAASLVSCLECHGGESPFGHHDSGDAIYTDCSVCHYGGNPSDALNGTAGQQMRNLWAGGFGITTGSGDTGTSEAHMEFQTQDDGVTRFEYGGSNGACVACHTHVAVDITYQKPSTYKFDATFEPLGGNETLDNFEATDLVISNSSGN